MRIFKKKISKGSVILFISMLLLIFSSVLIFSNIRMKDELVRSQRGYYSENAVFMESKTDSAEAFQAGLQNEDLSNLILYKSKLEINSDARGIYFKGKTEPYPIKSGRYFNESDLSGEKRIALIGENYIKDTIIKEAKRFMEILGQEFEVVGVLGVSQPTRLDGIILIPLDTAIALTGTDGVYYLDCKTKELVDKNSSLLSSILERDIYSYSESPSGIGFNLSNTVTNIYIAILFAFILTSIFTTANWISHRKQMIQVERLMGFQNLQIISSIFLRFITIPVLASAASFVLVIIINLFTDIFKLQISDAVIALLLVFVSGAVIVAFNLVRILRSKELEFKR